MSDDEFFEWLKRPANGSCKIVYAMGDGRYCAIKPLLFHWTMIIGQIGDLDGYDDRYCYADDRMANAAAIEWQAAGWAGEPAGWHRHPQSGRRRVMGDPDRESIAW